MQGRGGNIKKELLLKDFLKVVSKLTNSEKGLLKNLI